MKVDAAVAARDTTRHAKHPAYRRAGNIIDIDGRSQTPLRLGSIPETRLRASRLAAERLGRSHACAAYGPGFVAVDGTDTCVKVGGSVSAEVKSGH